MECESMDFKCFPTESDESNILISYLLQYLVDMELLKFKFLWKRLPKHVKSENYAKIIYGLARELWKQDFVSFFQILNTCDVINVLKKEDRELIINNIRKKNIESISSSYNNIHLSKFSNYMGLNEEETLSIVQNENWRIDEFNFVYPQPLSIIKRNDYGHGKESISKLCQFMTHMENN